MDKNIRVSALEIANWFVEKASQTPENDLTNLKLQKLLYFAQGKFLATTGNPLFNEQIEAWVLGPVVRSVYDEFKSCGSFPITAFDGKVKKSSLPANIDKFLINVWEEFGRYSANYLVDLTHKEGSPWETVYTKDKNSDIPFELMTKYFRSSVS